MISRISVHAAALIRPVAAAAISLAAVFCFSGCDRQGTPDWETHATEAPIPVAVQAPAQEPIPEASEPPPATEESQAGLRFIAYNVKNWLVMDRYVDRKSLKNSPKPEAEKEAVIAILARHKPDVVGLCEIGTVGDLAEIQERLKAAGIDLPHSHFTGGSDQVRHLGFLSRYPIVATGKPEKTDFQIKGKIHSINRGILDATIEANGRRYHFLGVHFKSKREVEEVDQEEMRRAEARALRRHADQILEKSPNERVVLYGDFNDTRSSVTGKNAFGNFNDPKYFSAIPASDSVGTRWTHFWALHEIYSRIDFVAVSQGLKPETEFGKAKILDDPEWETASDHRAVLAIFR